MPSKWNSGDPNSTAVVAPVTTTRAAIRFLLRDAALIAVSAVALNWRQDSVLGSKRKLYGLPPPAPKQEPLRQRRPFALDPQRAGAAPGAPQMTPITPPQRYGGPSSAGGVLAGTPYSTASGTPGVGVGGSLMGTPQPGADGLDRGAGRTPLSDPYRRSPQPAFSPAGAVVASPEQLSFYLDSLGGGAGAGGAAASPAAADMAASMYGYGVGAGATTPAYAVPSDMDQGPAGALPVGASAPYYRMTWMPKKAAAVAAADTPTLSPSAPEEVEDFVVSVLRARQDWLELWVERLREWLAGRVLKPLVAAVATAHEPVNTLLQQFSAAPRLPPLPDLLSDARSAGGVDVDGVLRSLQASLAQHVAGQPAAPTTPKAKELLAAVNRYADLLAVVRGKRPADILPPANTPYVWARLQQLADSTCLKDFVWNGGSAHAGRPWTADQLPTDSALVLYLFTAYLDAPGWQFTAPPNTQAEGVSQPLHLGSLPAGPRAASACSAVLTYRPERHGRELDALLGLQLQSASPLFCYLAGGRLMVLANYQYVAVFHAILFFLQYHKVRYGGAIGRQHMDDPDLGLDAVVQPPQVGALVSLGAKVFGRMGWFV
ncbi:hypothetical protein GPECTOR_217g448 [Gonium pectorale]|uniref:Transmembrane protein 209 n=1 Tax=Gonium pectorale TaxID=33097 RepID=A0A150FWQ4_GONPE|nr:hypothetical protein GPECTOR_217g448 [Gonium pectorale]|eukprot:KXZ42041.1 hypothetical protein GPECTOR_217g448 [Gonium pectorale]